MGGRGKRVRSATRRPEDHRPGDVVSGRYAFTKQKLACSFQSADEFAQVGESRFQRRLMKKYSHSWLFFRSQVCQNNQIAPKQDRQASFVLLAP
jgi:hypothetical protein